jgi:hypothetical protein
MPETEEQIEETPETEEDILDMSDEDFAKLAEPSTPSPEPEEVEEPPEEEESSADETDSEDTEDEEEQEEDKAEPEEKASETEEEPDGSQAPQETEEDEETEKDESSDSDSVDFKSEYNKVMAPFKANGTEMKVKSVDDVRRLMEMGANYHKKMSALKPSLKTLKLLEKNELLDPDKVNFLIDLHNKNPEAITQLLKDSEIDPLDINVKEDSSYKPTNRAVSDTELALDSVLDDLKGTETYERTLNVVTEEWDDASRNTIAAAPHILTKINGHIADGTFDQVMERVTYERNLGRLSGLSDFEAYAAAGDALCAEGKLQIGTPSKPPAQNANSSVKAKPSQKEIERRKKKKAASPVKTTKTPAQPTFNPLEMSDEEFAKFDLKHFQTL